MWIVLKYKKRELCFLMDELKKKIGKDIKFFNPKIKYQKNLNNMLKEVEINLLDNYILCFHESFKNKISINRFKYCRGLINILDGWYSNQIDLKGFIDSCKKCQDKSGFLTQNFFDFLDIKEAKFISGPFADMLFYILSKTKKHLKISINNKIAIIDNNAGYLYQAV
jgi:hypothetical protein